MIVDDCRLLYSMLSFVYMYIDFELGASNRHQKLDTRHRPGFSEQTLEAARHFHTTCRPQSAQSALYNMEAGNHQLHQL